VTALEATLAIGQSGSAKVSEVVEALFGRALPHLAVRAALFAGGGTPFDLEPFRKKPREVPASASV
jgi:hypothetical protein